MSGEFLAELSELPVVRGECHSPLKQPQMVMSSFLAEDRPSSIAEESQRGLKTNVGSLRDEWKWQIRKLKNNWGINSYIFFLSDSFCEEKKWWWEWGRRRRVRQKHAHKNINKNFMTDGTI